MGSRGNGSPSANNRKYGGSGNLDIKETTSLVSMRETKQTEVDKTLSAFKDVYDKYGTVVDDIQIAKLGAKDAQVMAYYDGANIAINDNYFNSASMDGAYDACVKSGYHPSRGNKTAIEAVSYHEIGHKLTDDYGKKMGYNYSDIDTVAKKICENARKNTNSKGVIQMAQKISGYAVQSNAECIAEAFADFYCNGKKAKAESKAIVNELDRVLLNK